MASALKLDFNVDYCVFMAHPASKLANVKQACIAITQAKYVYVAEDRAQVLVHLSILSPTGGGVDHGVGILKFRNKRFKFPTPGNQKKWSKSPPEATEGGQMSVRTLSRTITLRTLTIKIW